MTAVTIHVVRTLDLHPSNPQPKKRTAATVLTTWMVTAVITTVLMVWGVVSSGFYLWPIVTSLCWMLRDGGCIFFACHMLYHCDHSEVSVAAVVVVYNCLGQLICVTLLGLFAGSATVQFVFVAVLLVVTIALVL